MKKMYDDPDTYYNVSYQDIYRTIESLKKEGVPFEDVIDALEFDSDQYPNPKDLKEARAKIYGRDV